MSMTTTADIISIRMATPDDAIGLARLAQLDSKQIAAGPVLIGERNGRLEAALALDAGIAIADPFVATGELVALLRLRAARLRPPASLAQRLGAPVIHYRRRRRAYAA
jgi:hypothetical protein